MSLVSKLVKEFFTLSLCRQTDRRATVKQYAPDLSIQGHKKIEVQGEIIAQQGGVDTLKLRLAKPQYLIMIDCIRV